MKNYSKIASFGFLIEDESEGQIYNFPLIGRQIFYQLNQRDADKFKKGVVFLTRLFLEGGAKKIMTLIHGHSTINSIAELEKLEKAKIRPWDIECMAFHPLGTCRMGTSEKTGVVGPDFQVFGHENLYVCDGSVIPSSLGVNPQVSIMSFATHCAELFKKRKRGVL